MTKIHARLKVELNMSSLHPRAQAEQAKITCTPREVARIEVAKVGVIEKDFPVLMNTRRKKHSSGNNSEIGNQISNHKISNLKCNSLTRQCSHG